MKIALSWSGGKDSTLALYFLKKSGVFQVEYLITTITKDYDRVTMHGVRRELVERQAESLGIKLIEVYIPAHCSNEEYEEIMGNVVKELRDKGVEGFAFGDIHLEDVRRYREKNLEKAGVKGVFPLWGRNPRELAELFINLGFEAIVVSVDSRKLPRDLVGQRFDWNFLSKLPSGVDIMGEYGEYHTFVYAGPLFRNRINVRLGEVVFREGFYFIDLIPG
ncbi:diphthine--ammonia ligase [Thermogladius sp. 4427co]|uniref:Dph6-related ATP pyrophosphatase n=1 Tax=Thermogladius sp. 4427co TaxID=3450718 RepID=UPI003F7AA9A2